MSSPSQRNTHLFARSWKSPAGPQPVPMEGLREEPGITSLWTPTQGWRCALITAGKCLTQLSTHTQTRCTAFVGGIFPLLSRGKILGEVTYAKYFYVVCISRALAGRLGKTEASSQAKSSPLGYNDLTAIWVAGSTRGLQSQKKTFLMGLGAFHFMQVTF